MALYGALSLLLLLLKHFVCFALRRLICVFSIHSLRYGCSLARHLQHVCVDPQCGLHLEPICHRSGHGSRVDHGLRTQLW